MAFPRNSRNHSIANRTTEMGFISATSWTLDAADLALGAANPFNDVFGWIQAFYSSADLTTTPTLLIWDGEYASDGTTPIINPIFFAFPGERVAIKGCAIVSSGVDRRGNTWSSTPIGVTPSTDLLLVSALGGVY